MRAQYMKSNKAKRFGDIAARRNTMAFPDPAHQQYIGRFDSNFDQELGERQRGDIVLRGNIAKFSTPPCDKRFWTQATRLSPKLVRMALIGASISDPMTRELSNPRCSQAQPFGRYPYEHPRPAGSLSPPGGTPFQPILHPIHSPQQWHSRDRCNPTYSDLDVYVRPTPAFSAVTAEADLPNPPPRLAELGPSLDGGIVTVDDASFITRIKVHNGLTITRYRLIALLDTDTLQTFITAGAWARMKT